MLSGGVGWGMGIWRQFLGELGQFLEERGLGGRLDGGDLEFEFLADRQVYGLRGNQDFAVTMCSEDCHDRTLYHVGVGEACGVGLSGETRGRNRGCHLFRVHVVAATSAGVRGGGGRVRPPYTTFPRPVDVSFFASAVEAGGRMRDGSGGAGVWVGVAFHER